MCELERLNKATSRHLHLVPACHVFESTFKNQALTALEEASSQFKIKPRRPLRKSQVRFKIKCLPPLNQIQFKNKLWKVNNWRNPESPPIQFKIKAVESQQVQQNTCRFIHYQSQGSSTT
ncbi:hypothetical protein ACFXTI_017053 [Malus domestica]